ncbi:MATE family efflux transporter [Paraglaciecola aquimarina]|uniref:Multidrug-efflux transporter n=1 Tax=Paraglaciecola algarum TaxID=3050085 RepID=A0ABS9D825_9ALTE|nr:MATE family efflux transporter [Paraglaciecola sp. G1-23]MCF2947964.1 MATE family efflux transporter [Paraglaciecola sp. G1-23]
MSETTEAQKKGLWGMSRPMLVEQGLQFSVPLLDTFFLSRISDSAASAAGAMTPVLFFCGNMLWAIVFAGAAVASQRLGAGNQTRTNATIGIYTIWALIGGLLLTGLLWWASPYVTELMGLPGQVQTNANIYMSIMCWLMVVWAFKGIFQSILNLYGKPQWNMYANIVYFTANVLGNGIVVFGLFGFPKMGIEGVAWASVVGSSLGVVVSGLAVFLRLKLELRWQNIKLEFKNASKNIGRIAVPNVIEPLSFDTNMIVLNSMAASLGTAALAAKVYTFNTFMLGLITSMALRMATEVLICQKVGANQYEQAIQQMKQSLKAALWGSGAVVIVLFAFHQPIMNMYSDNEVVLGAAVWMFLLAALSEPPRTINIMVGGVLRATGDGFLISIVGPLFTWIVALPAAYLMAFTLGWGIYGIMASAILDEGVRAGFYWYRWKQGHWQHSHVSARELRNSNKVKESA